MPAVVPIKIVHAQSLLEAQALVNENEIENCVKYVKISGHLEKLKAAEASLLPVVVDGVELLQQCNNKSVSSTSDGSSDDSPTSFIKTPTRIVTVPGNLLFFVNLSSSLLLLLLLLLLLVLLLLLY